MSFGVLTQFKTKRLLTLSGGRKFSALNAALVVYYVTGLQDILRSSNSSDKFCLKLQLSVYSL